MFKLNSLSVLSPITASISGTAQQAVSSSYANSVQFSNISALPVNLVSSSLQVNTGSFSGSITTASYATVSQNTIGSAATATSASYVPTRSNITFTLGKSSGSITEYGYKGCVAVPTNARLTTASMFTSGSGSVHWDIRRINTIFDFSPNAGTSITGSALFSSSNATRYVSPLTSWTTEFIQNDILTFHLIATSGNVSAITVVFTIER